MSPLWMKKQQTKTIKQNPSPNHENILRTVRAHACSSAVVNFIPGSTCIRKSIKEALPGILRKKRNQGSMTVEAAILLPVFLFFFLNLLSFLEVLRLHGKIERGLWDVGSDLCLYSYAFTGEETIAHSEEKKQDWWRDLADVALSYSYVKGRLVERLGEDYLEASPLTYGPEGLRFVGSDLTEHPDIIDLTVTYRVSPFCESVGYPDILIQNHYYAHAWTGYWIPGTEEENKKQKEYYVTDYGEVYHCKRECTHLDLSIQQVSLTKALSSRNQYGRKYRKCETCGKRRFWGKTWITDEGDCYHFEVDCPGLKRTIYRITEKEKKKYRPCSRCAR